MKKLLTFVLICLLGLTLSVYIARSSSAEANDTQQALDQPQIQTEIIERDLIYDFKIPSQGEIARTKKEIKESNEYRNQEKRLGKKRAEKNLDEKIQTDINYMKNMNQKGKGKIQLATVKTAEGDVGSISTTYLPYFTAPYFTIWTYEKNIFGACTDTQVDPMNLLFWDHGSARDVSYNLIKNVSPAWGYVVAGSQCAWTGTDDPGSLNISQLKRQTYQWQNGNFWIRHHIRIWSAPSYGEWGEWSVASTHHETWSWTYFDHCVDSPYGFEDSEHFVRDQMNQVSGTYEEKDVGNKADLSRCGQPVYSDGLMPFINLPVDTPY